VQGDVLVVSVEEAPAIAQIDISGVKDFSSDVVRRVLREQGLAEGRIFERSLLETSAQELNGSIFRAANTGAEVQTTVTPLERNRVAINIAVTEGDVAKIRSINLVGVQAFREKDLLDLFVLRTQAGSRGTRSTINIRASASLATWRRCAPTI